MESRAPSMSSSTTRAAAPISSRALEPIFFVPASAATVRSPRAVASRPVPSWVRQTRVTLRRRWTRTASGRVIERVMTKAMNAESASATAMTIQMVRWPLLALAEVAASAARFSASSSRASAERLASSWSRAGVTSPT